MKKKLNVIILENKKEIGEYVAKLISDEIKKNPSLVLGLATGKTMIPVYNSLIKKNIKWSKVKTFNLDEYVGMNEKDERSFRKFMNINLFNKIEIKKENIFFLNGRAESLKSECNRYEKELKRAGGVGLQILGLGRNGHIAFNEPGTEFSSKTRVAILTQNTRKANSGEFNNQIKKVPKKALTLGLKNIMDAKKVIMVAFGKKKRKAVKGMIKGNVSKKCPASILRKHKNVIVFLDKEASKDV